MAPKYQRALRRGSRRPLAAAALLASLGATIRGAREGFATGRPAPPRVRAATIPRRADVTTAEAVTEAAGVLDRFEGSWWSLGTVGLTYILTLPGFYSLVKRTGQAAYTEKSYVLPGPATASGLKMKSIAGGIFAYFKTINYTMEKSPQEGKIRFVGNMQASMSQALYLVSCAAAALFSIGIVGGSLAPDGPFGLGQFWWYSGTLLSPFAGLYYWGQAYRQDIVEMSMEEADDHQSIELTVLADKETVNELQKGVRFQSAKGGLMMLQERDMEYQPGIFDAVDESRQVIAPVDGVPVIQGQVPVIQGKVPVTQS